VNRKNETQALCVSSCSLGLLCFGLVLSSVSCKGSGNEGDQGIVELEQAFPHLSFIRPLDLEQAGDGSDRLFVVEQAGRISVFPNDPTVTGAKIFLDIHDHVDDSGNEMGLLGLAFDPEYASTGHFYVDYTAGNPRRTVISEFSVAVSNPDSADPTSETILLEFDQPYENHNGGRVMFGPDGNLYIGTGDGGSGGDPNGNAQNLNTLLGKILRIDVKHPSGGLHYGIPADNPFVNTGHRGEIWAYGLRNPWRFSYDAVSGRMWAGDVGQDAIEEIDIIEKGKNYGWNIMEGNSCFKPSLGCDTSGLIPPVWQYTHAFGVSVTGGFVYRGSRHPELTGSYIYADYGSGRIWSLRADNGAPPANTELTDSSLPIASFGEDERHELYICSFDGKIYRFR
jgi:glucose/arabinose dehydrogenase